MQRNLLKQISLTIILSGFAFSPAALSYFYQKNTFQQSKPAFFVKKALVSFQLEQPRQGLPVRLKIPKISIDTTLEYVGLTPEGNVDVPAGPFNAAWYELSPRPGEKGNAIITGHFGWKNGIPAIFDYLYKLRKGDKIYIEDETGTTTTFIVRESRRYAPSAGSSDVFVSNDERAHLNLITCEGIWNKTEKSYSKRLVVFADKEIK
ncbi:MAG: class F sortase [Candidatus Paceibacterota bacterium]|jgi:LPXTG-site transpeptidase (sortase) family protein